MTAVSDKSHLQREIELHRHISDDYRIRYGHPFSQFYNRYWNGRLIALLPRDRQARVLDLGCGTGFLLDDLIQHYPHAVGFDLSESMLAVAREKERVAHRLVAGDGGQLPFKDACFDAVVCRGSLHHLPELDTALCEIRRVLAENGSLIFTEPSNDALLIRAARRVMYHLSDKFDEEDEGYHLTSLVRAMEEAGFAPQDVGRFGFLGYAFAGFPDRLGWLIHLPGSMLLTRLFIAVDKTIEHLPGIRRLCFQILGAVGKRHETPEDE